MDITDAKILEILQEDGRISMKELGKRVSLTSPAVSERVKRLEENGIIKGYKAVVNPIMLGLNVSVIIHVGLNVSAHKTFLAFVNNHEAIVECHHVTGNDCMTIRAMVSDTLELETLLDEIQAIGSTRTEIVLSTPLEHKPILPRNAK